jgi:hypothetical protein
MAKKKHESAASAAPPAPNVTVDRVLETSDIIPGNVAKSPKSSKGLKPAKTSESTKPARSKKLAKDKVAEEEGETAASAMASAAAEPRTLSPYNLFMKTHLAEIKREQPDVVHKAAFAMVATAWATAPENPKNQSNDSDRGKVQPLVASVGPEMAATNTEGDMVMDDRVDNDSNAASTTVSAIATAAASGKLQKPTQSSSVRANAKPTSSSKKKGSKKRSKAAVISS